MSEPRVTYQIELDIELNPNAPYSMILALDREIKLHIGQEEKNFARTQSEYSGPSIHVSKNLDWSADFITTWNQSSMKQIFSKFELAILSVSYLVWERKTTTVERKMDDRCFEVKKQRGLPEVP